ncbi:MAG: SH3 domain-containing protein, partial [Lachnospiraceae bacterium]|nr:SH3 domain-containing protein [Lachnospiraceae bacterium]
MKREKEERRLLKNQRKLVIYFILIILLAGMYRTNYEQMWAQNTTEFFAELTEISSRFLASHLSDIETEGEVLTIGNTENASAMLSENEPKAIGSIVIRAWLLNVREEPNGTILGTVAKEEVHPYYEERDGWVRIKFNGGYGYVAGGYGDRYDPSGNIIAFANIPESTPAEEQSVQAQTE